MNSKQGLKPATLLISALMLAGCSSQIPSNSNFASELKNKESVSLSSHWQGVYDDWEGVPYRWGGNSKSGVDCSAFTQIVMQGFSVTPLARTTRDQVKQGVNVPYSNAQQGDLVFFKIRRKQYHVGVYLGQNQFLHASTSKGVIISRLDNPYWADAFWQFRRVN